MLKVKQKRLQKKLYVLKLVLPMNNKSIHLHLSKWTCHTSATKWCWIAGLSFTNTEALVWRINHLLHPSSALLDVHAFPHSPKVHFLLSRKCGGRKKGGTSLASSITWVVNRQLPSIFPAQTSKFALYPRLSHWCQLGRTVTLNLVVVDEREGRCAVCLLWCCWSSLHLDQS